MDALNQVHRESHPLDIGHRFTTPQGKVVGQVLSCCITGWNHNDAGLSVSPKEGYRDDMYESDWRGHCLDATSWIPAGSCEVRYSCVFQTYAHRH